MKTAKSKGVDFAIMRVTWTGYSKSKHGYRNIDSSFASNYKSAKAAGMMVGVYVFSQAKNETEARKEAKFAIERLNALGIKPKDLALPVYMDYEFAGSARTGRLYGLTRTAGTKAAIAFCDEIRKAGYKPGIYANTSFFNRYITVSQLPNDVDLWCAQYYKRCESGIGYTKWQYSSSARIGGLFGTSNKIDVNFWYLNKKKNANPITTIKGKTTFKYTGEAIKPSYTIYHGKTKLKEGTDYTVNGINNVNVGKGYAYIKGIGKYDGYALVPMTIKKSVGTVKSKSLNSKSANYIVKYTAPKVNPSTPASTPAETASVKYKVGKQYKLQTALKVRTGPSTSYKWKKRSSLTADAKKSAYPGYYAVLKKGTKVTCKKVSGNWMKIPSGWICCKEGSEIYVK